MNLETVSLPIRRPFRWRALWILVGLQLLGNLAAVPLLLATNRLVEPVSDWILWTAVSVPIIGIGLYLAGRIGLGAPFIEGQLKREEISGWAESVFALTLIVAIVGSLPFLVVPVYLSKNPLACVATAVGLNLVVVISWRALILKDARPSSLEM